MQVSIETITPDLAAAYLTTSTGNRSLKAAKVQAYSRDMIAGDWQENGESIIFDGNGALIDGHHRLTACVKSDHSFRSAVVRGVASDAKKTIDMGSSRSVADALALHGHKHTNHMSAVISALFSLKNGRPRSANPTSTEVFDFIAAWPDIEAAATIAAGRYLPRAHAVCGAIWFVATINGERDKAEQFLEVLSSGIPSRPGCPAHALRERVLRDMVLNRPMSLPDLQRTVVFAWEKFRAGQSVKKIKAPKAYKITGWG